MEERINIVMKDSQQKNELLDNSPVAQTTNAPTSSKYTLALSLKQLLMKENLDFKSLEIYSHNEHYTTIEEDKSQLVDQIKSNRIY